MKIGLYWTYSTRSLIRGGQRTVLAIFCVAVGVMAIVALQLVGLSVNQALLGNIIEANGGDIRLNADLAPLRQPDMVFFDKLKHQKRITDYATAYDPGGSITLPTGEEETFSFIAVSHNFPLVGQANFVAPTQDLQMQNVVSGRSRISRSADYYFTGNSECCPRPQRCPGTSAIRHDLYVRTHCKS